MMANRMFYNPLWHIKWSKLDSSTAHKELLFFFKHTIKQDMKTKMDLCIAFLNKQENSMKQGKKKQ